MAALLAFYLKCLETTPLMAKSFSAGLLLAVADYTCQRFENSKKEIDLGRILRVAMFAAVLGVPALNIWYGLLDSQWPGHTLKFVLIKLLLDQFFFTPMSILIFFVLLGFGEGKIFKDITVDLRQNFFSTMKTSLIIWPLASFINFYFVDARYRLVFVGCVSIFWNGYLSSVKHQPQGGGSILPISFSGKIAIT